MSNKTLGQIAFEAYNTQRGGVTYDNKPIPPWERVAPGVQEAWEAAAQTIRSWVLSDPAENHNILIALVESERMNG